MEVVLKNLLTKFNDNNIDIYEQLILSSYILLNLNSNENYKKILPNLSIEVKKFLNIFTEKDLNYQNIKEFFSSEKNAKLLYQEIQNTLLSNKHIIFEDLQEQYIGIKSNLNKCDLLHHILFKQGLKYNRFFEKEYNDLLFDFKLLKESFEPYLFKSSISETYSPDLLLDLYRKKVILEKLENFTLIYRKKLVKEFKVPFEQLGKYILINSNQTFSEKELYQICNSNKRFLTKFDKEFQKQPLDIFHKVLHEEVFLKIRKKSFFASIEYGYSHMDKPIDFDFYKKNVADIFSFGIANLWSRYCLDFSTRITKDIFNTFSSNTKNSDITFFDFQKQFDEFTSFNVNVENLLRKSIKDTMRKEKPELLFFNNKTSSISLNQKFLDSVKNDFIDKILKDVSFNNFIYQKPLPEGNNKYNSIFKGLLRKTNF